TKAELSVLLCKRCSRSHTLPRHSIPNRTVQEDLRYGRLLSKLEVRNIPSTISNATQHLKSIDDEVVVLQAKLEGMMELKRIVQCAIDARQALLAPVRRLPDELLAEIFSLACGNGEDIEKRWPMPLTLSSVSSIWRDDIAVSLPKIWSRIRWNLRSKSIVVDRLPLYLSRVGNATFTHPVMFAPLCRDIFKMILEHSGLWRSLVTRASEFFDDFNRRALPRLEKLEVDVEHLPPGDSANGAVFEGAPLLRHLHIINYSRLNFTAFHFHWAQITTLSTNCTDAYLCNVLLVDCPHLVTLMHHTRSKGDENLPITAHHTLEHLRSMTVIVSFDGPSDEYCWMLDHLTTPRLQS
ncbi:hypothetical protein BD626DRAFT_388474, partial [Schizophyllum amplum]